MAKKQNDDELISTGRRKKKAKDNDIPVNGVKVDFSVKEHRYNKYYMSVAGKYRAVRYLSTVMLFVFLAVMLLFFRENITYSNLMYLIRDLDTAGETESSAGAYSNITYDGQYADEFDLFKGRVIVAGSAGITVYDSSGSKETDYDSAYSVPKIEAGEKYMLMFDRGTENYSVYNSVARVLSAKADNKIDGAAVSDSGYYALLTGSEESKYLITVYNSSFKPVAKYYKEKYVIDLDMDAEGKNMAIVSAASSESSVSCEVTFAKVGTEDLKSLEYPGIMPLSAHYTSDGTLIVVCDTAIMGFRDFELVWRHDFGGASPNVFCVNKDIVVSITANNAIGSSNEALIFDINGEILYNINLERKITDIATDGKTAVYAVGDGVGTRIDLNSGNLTEEEITVTPKKLLAPEGSLIVCGENGTDSHFCS